MPTTTIIFDAYGTLFDVAAAARQAAQEPDFATIRDSWPTIAEDWRQKQLQYTWLRAVTGGAHRFLAGHARGAGLGLGQNRANRA